MRNSMISIALCLWLCVMGCADTEYFVVNGSVTVTTDGIPDTGFSFTQDTNLVDDRVDSDATMAGHCVIELSNNALTAVDFALLRTASEEGDNALRTFRLDHEDTAIHASIELGVDTFDSPENDTCSIDLSVEHLDSTRLRILVDCEMVSESAQVAHTTGNLRMDNCEIQ